MARRNEELVMLKAFQEVGFSELPLEMDQFWADFHDE